MSYRLPKTDWQPPSVTTAKVFPQATQKADRLSIAEFWKEMCCIRWICFCTSFIESDRQQVLNFSCFLLLQAEFLIIVIAFQWSDVDQVFGVIWNTPTISEIINIDKAAWENKYFFSASSRGVWVGENILSLLRLKERGYYFLCESQYKTRVNISS